MRVLAVGAHPDDIELGCGATLALYKARGHRVDMLVLTEGEASSNPAVNKKCCEKSARILGADHLFFGNLKDTRIDDGSETISIIEHLLTKSDSEIIFTHSTKDKHQDHRNTGLASLSAARRSRAILLYESPTALREFVPQVFVDVGSTFPKKMTALRMFGFRTGPLCYHNHRRKHVQSAIEGLARYRGFQSETELAEAFEVGRLLLSINRGS